MLLTFANVVWLVHYIIYRRGLSSNLMITPPSLEQLVSSVIGKDSVQHYSSTNYAQVSLRMDTYARLQGIEVVDASEDRILGPDGYKILLGILKKIESKSNFLAALVIFAAIAFLTLISIDVPYDDWGRREICLGCASALMYIGLLLVGNFHHLDQAAANVALGKSLGDEGGMLKEMEKQLIDDLLRKEVEFEGSCWGVIFSGVIFIAVTMGMAFVSPFN